MVETNDEDVALHPTGIAGFDYIGNGGLPEGRATLLAGTAGSGKTVFACQFLAEGIKHFDERGVFVTFEEPKADIRRNVRGFGWDVRTWEEDGRWTFVDTSPQPDDDPVLTGDFEFTALLARIRNAVVSSGARRLALDSIGALLTRFGDAIGVRRELRRLVVAIRELGVTTVMTLERTEDYGPVSRFGVEEFATDNVVLLRNVLEDEKRRRTIEILKYRGLEHRKGEFAFSVTAGRGIIVIPISSIELKQRSTEERVRSGVNGLDEMCGGGLFRDSIVLVSGATGAGKTLMASSFVHGGALDGERCLYLAFEESREQLVRNARGWGFDFQALEDQGLLRIDCAYPEVSGAEDHMIRIQRLVEEFEPNRVTVDSLSALERVATERSFREFVIGLTSYLKAKQVCGLYTSTSRTLLGGESVTEAHISTLTDTIILLRFVEMWGVMRRGITLLKMRGSTHDKAIREYQIDSTGMHIGEPFEDVSGILSGHVVYRSSSHEERIASLFNDDG